MTLEPISPELRKKHEQVVARLKATIFAIRSLRDYRFDFYEAVEPIFGHVWEAAGGLRFIYTNPYKIKMCFSVEHQESDQFIVFVNMLEPSHCFGYRVSNLAGLPACLLRLSEENWIRDSDAYANKRG